MNFQVIGPLYEKLTETFDKETALGWTLAIAASTCAVSLLTSIVSLNLSVPFHFTEIFLESYYSPRIIGQR